MGQTQRRFFETEYKFIHCLYVSLFSFDATVSVKAWLSDNTDANYVAGSNAQERGILLFELTNLLNLSPSEEQNLAILPLKIFHEWFLPIGL